ncbi:MAG: ATP-binding protein [Candidatus Kapaibacterium sp.]|nr:MAG: ATP-binding protein [Candidatus Kapabacteria bacterium]
MKAPYLNRILTQSITQKLTPAHIVILLGARRVGKTALLEHIGQQFSGSVLRLNGESLETHELFARQTAANYRKLFGATELLLLDEAQAMPNAASHLKFLVDEVPQVRILATGSAPIDVRDIGAPLVGRSTTLHLYPFSFAELSAHEHPLETRANLEERLIYGSYPGVWHCHTFAEKAAYLHEILHTYLLKDILAFETVRQSSKLLDLLRLIAFQIGQEVSLTELGTQLGMSKNTVERYLDLLEKVFVVVRRSGFAGNMRNQIAKSHRWYFVDNGIRNAVIGNFSLLASREGQEIGRLWENYCISERLKFNTSRDERRWTQSYFLRTYTQQEIDLIECSDGSNPGIPLIQAFECKWSPKAKQRIPSAWKEAYPDAPVHCLHRENYDEFFQ